MITEKDFPKESIKGLAGEELGSKPLAGVRDSPQDKEFRRQLEKAFKLMRHYERDIRHFGVREFLKILNGHSLFNHSMKQDIQLLYSSIKDHWKLIQLSHTDREGTIPPEKTQRRLTESYQRIHELKEKILAELERGSGQIQLIEDKIKFLSDEDVELKELLDTLEEDLTPEERRFLQRDSSEYKAKEMLTTILGAFDNMHKLTRGISEIYTRHVIPMFEMIDDEVDKLEELRTKGKAIEGLDFTTVLRQIESLGEELEAIIQKAETDLKVSRWMEDELMKTHLPGIMKKLLSHKDLVRKMELKPLKTKIRHLESANRRMSDTLKQTQVKPVRKPRTHNPLAEPRP